MNQERPTNWVNNPPMDGVVLSEISSPPATSTSAVNESATEGGEGIVLGAFFSLLRGSNREVWGAGRDRKQSDAGWRATERAPEYGVGQYIAPRARAGGGECAPSLSARS